MGRIQLGRIGKTLVLLFAFSSILAPLPTYSAEKGKGERIDVENIKEKFWAKGDPNEIRVLQNRLYQKEGRIELGAFFGKIATDPFLKVYNYGGTATYHFSEYFGAGLIYWQTLVSASSALSAFRSQTGYTVRTNNPFSMIGAEASLSPLYGKLSLLGKAIIYFDLHLLGGVGRTKTESGTNLTPWLGIGQQIYLAKSLCLRLDYRMTYYKEAVLDKPDAAPSQRTVDSTRQNFSEVVTLGLTLFAGPL